MKSFNKHTAACPYCHHDNTVVITSGIRDNEIRRCTYCGEVVKINYDGYKLRIVEVSDGEFTSLTFPDTPVGQREKLNHLHRYADMGWSVVSETITSGKFKGQRACILFLICVPLALLAGHEDDTINVTLQYHKPDVQIKQGMKKCPYCAEHIKVDAIKCPYCAEKLPM